MDSKLYILTIVLAVLVVINIFFVLSSSKYPIEPTKLSENTFNSTQAYILPISESSYIPILNSQIEKPIISAKSAIVYDLRSSRFLFIKNSPDKLPIASLTKILSAIVVLDNLSLKDVVTIPKEVIKVDEEKQGLYLGEEISVENLLKLMLIESSNDAAYALAWHANNQGINFMDKMNDRALILRMTNSHFLDPAGLNDNAYSSAEDLLKLIKASFKYQFIWDLLSEKNLVVKSDDGKIEHKVESTDQLLGVMPNIIGGKTGYTDGALGCLILVVDVPDKDDKMISIVLGSKERFTDTKKLIDWIKEAYRWQ